MDGLDDRPFPDKDLIEQRHETIAHIRADTGQEMQSLRREVLEQELRKISIVAYEFVKQRCCQLWHWTPILHIAWREAERQDLVLVVDDQMEFAAKDPARRGFPPFRQVGEDPMLRNAGVLADG